MEWNKCDIWTPIMYINIFNIALVVVCEWWCYAKAIITNYNGIEKNQFSNIFYDVVCITDYGKYSLICATDSTQRKHTDSQYAVCTTAHKHITSFQIGQIIDYYYFIMAGLWRIQIIYLYSLRLHTQSFISRGWSERRKVI